MNILVTGGASGLGKYLTRKLAADKNNTVFVTYAHSADAAALLENEFPNVHSRHCDFTTWSDVLLLQEAMESMQLDALVNNAIVGMTLEHFHAVKSEDFIERFRKNVSPAVAITQKAIRLFRKQMSGRILTVLTSYLFEEPPLGLSVYVAEKAYLASLCKSWATENARFNISSNAISPSFMSTSLTRHIDPRAIKNLSASALDPQVVADTVALLLAQSPAHTGVNILLTPKLKKEMRFATYE